MPWPFSSSAKPAAPDAASDSGEPQALTTPVMASASEEPAKGLKRTYDEIYVVLPDSIGECAC